MVHLLGAPLRDSWRTKFALKTFYGIGDLQASRICARLQIHDACRMMDLTPYQMTSLAAFLSSPKTSPQVPLLPTAAPNFRAPPPTTVPNSLRLEYHKAREQMLARSAKKKKEPWKDPLNDLKIENDLKKDMRDAIAHHKEIGSYVGRRHALGLPVRGQNTQGNAKTAKKLNRIDRLF
ncbi:hypothetical protein DL96DRAFT_1528834 [Flagelloscypha sp. PMI_526]|nr:hypothetical protein DL96DRAFT_1528834 [Flagelloscypha sp. PMI_526]